MPEFKVNGIVAMRDGKPYIQLMNDTEIIGQFTMSEARSIAMDILTMCSRTEMDAMIHEFFSHLEAPEQATGAAMQMFREYRAALDAEKVERSMGPDPSAEGSSGG